MARKTQRARVIAEFPICSVINMTYAAVDVYQICVAAPVVNIFTVGTTSN